MRPPEGPTIWLLIAACTAADPFVIVVEGDPVTKQTRPLAGGRVSSGDNWDAVVASDEDGDRIVVHDLYAKQGYDEERHMEIRLPSGWAPGAVSIVNNDIAAVVAQGAGAIVFFSLVEFHLDVVAPVCPDPRDIDFIPDSTTYAWVACADGRLVKVGWPSGDTEQSWFIAPDLAHLFVHGAGDAFVATSTGGEVLRVDLTRGTVVSRYVLPSAAGGEGTAPSVVRRITYAGDEAVYVLHEAEAESMLTRIGFWDDAMTTMAVDATLPHDVVAWAAGDASYRIPTPVVGAGDIGGGPGAKSVEPLAAPDDAREVGDRSSFLLTEGPVVGVALEVSGPIAVTRDPFSVVLSDGTVLTSDASP